MEVLRVHPPLDLRPSAQYPQSRAWGIHQDAIGHLWQRLAELPGILHDYFHRLQPQVSQPAMHRLRLSRMNVAGDDTALICHALRDVSGLPTGSGARIDNRLPWLRVEEVRDNHGAEILHSQRSRFHQRSEEHTSELQSL